MAAHNSNRKSSTGSQTNRQVVNKLAQQVLRERKVRFISDAFCLSYPLNSQIQTYTLCNQNPSGGRLTSSRMGSQLQPAKDNVISTACSKLGEKKIASVITSNFGINPAYMNNFHTLNYNEDKIQIMRIHFYEQVQSKFRGYTIIQITYLGSGCIFNVRCKCSRLARQ